MFTLILPHFLRPADEILPELHTPAFNQLCRHAHFQAAVRDTATLYQSHLCDKWVLPENAVYASPLNQQIGLNTVSAQHGTQLAITPEEAQTWCDGLNQLYGNDAHFHVLRPDLWCVELPYSIDWQMENIFNLNHILQAHHAPKDWLQLFTETQMWLHQHPLNQNRKPYPINGLWLWRMDNLSPRQNCTVRASDSIWTSHSSTPCQTMPENWAIWQQFCATQHIDLNETHIFSEAFIHAMNAWEYADELAKWDKAFFAPIYDALVSGSLKNVKLITEQGKIVIHKPKIWSCFKRIRQFNGKQF